MIGLLPAAGKAERLHGIPKYLLPIGDTYLLKWHQEQMASAGVDYTYVMHNEQNHRLISEHLHDGNRAVTVRTETMTETVLEARELCGDETVLFGMPDTYFTDPTWEPYKQIVEYLEYKAVDVVLGLWHIRESQRGKLGQVDRRDDGFVYGVQDKNPDCNLFWAWGIMAWKPSFWQYLKPEMPHVGYGINPAIADGLNVFTYPSEGLYWDCGTADEYFELVMRTQISKRIGGVHLDNVRIDTTEIIGPNGVIGVIHGS